MHRNKDQEKVRAERLQTIIEELLRIEDNKYCVDCDTKGPRWASWNIGVFLCIRCAGIHRNLGVHISKVKSVNLDAWTTAQLAMMCDMGNSRARAIYEARIPENFRRPTSDLALESFIRDKYERKRYIAPDYDPIKPDVESLIKRLEQMGKKQRDQSNFVSVRVFPHNQFAKNTPSSVKNSTASQPQPHQINLLDFDASSTSQKPARAFELDVFGENVDPTPSTWNFSEATDTNVASKSQTNSLSEDLLSLNFSDTPSCTNAINTSTVTTSTTVEHSDAKITKDAILALYKQNSSCPANRTTLLGTGNNGVLPGWQQTTSSTSSCPLSNLSHVGYCDTSTPPVPFMSNSATQLTTNCANPSPSILMPQNTSLVQNIQSNAITWSTYEWPLFDQNFTSPTLVTQRPMMPNCGSMVSDTSTNWDLVRPSHPVALPLNTNLTTSGFRGPMPCNPSSTEAHQAYLSQVQSQLASLQLNTAVRNPQ